MRPTSLVGMSMRARRDAARKLAVGQVVTVPPHLAFAGHKGPIERIRWPYVEVRMSAGITNSIHVRDLMRLGERLRLCPWYHGASGCLGYSVGEDCKGSDVLPARKGGRP